MPLTSQSRIAKDRLKPRITELWRALAPLQTVVSFMNTGAHPDDETSAMLAAMALRDGIDISYACSTRGEGGQNDIGTEVSELLGVLRTAEMERACDILSLRMYWLSTSQNDTIFDFGFSKSGVETMGNWGRDRTLARFVDILRTERPDIICPTFLDIPGQHGHHRAMTEAAHLVMDLAADPDYSGSDLPVWQVKKLYQPAWSGAGQAYDDDLPPPPATLTVFADGTDPVTGWSYEQIGQQSRAFHLTQAMGKWVPAGAERNWPLHLAQSNVAGPDDTVFAGLPYDLRALGFGDAQDYIDAARAAFPDFAAVLKSASAALTALEQGQVAPEHAHKIARKQEQLALVIRIATGARVHVSLSKDALLPTDAAQVDIDQRKGLETKAETRLSLPKNWSQTSDGVALKNADLSDPYPSVYLPHQPQDPCLILKLETHGTVSETRIAFDIPPLVLPDCVAELLPLAEVINLGSERRTIQVNVKHMAPNDARPALELPDEWAATDTETGFLVSLPRDSAVGTRTAKLLLNNQPAQTVRRVNYSHIDPRALAQPASVNVAVLDAALPNVKVGYIGGGNDRVDHWLERIGMDVEPLTSEDLQSDARLAEFDSLVIGIFAMKFHKGLAEQMPRIHKWVAAGGTLLTLYHRPWDNWNSTTTAPKRLEIGQPSLRWRVTDQNALVTHLVDHPILTSPNKITHADWQGWHKERGLYFAKSWDKAYTPVLEMSDPNEDPHQGALVTANIGMGRHTHCALILHHQLEKLVPGAFRLMANLLAKRS
ncbi:PIG-L family deacetylase [Pelagimonas varians]|uniref:Mycothiol S-conjugate amidase n=1 Tax=Pelagimonas varians TaxID=696760 RepID=A0A238L611_9RHOB|nr:PIG-L family deacetylase [Pelagimonas varians]PYG25505.1 GlcNAc-PI de-N-acetylase [Pelagimonas varians]SMX50251.1 Mycothiol S-conjugate amidase [Pelagimonas varians]